MVEKRFGGALKVGLVTKKFPLSLLVICHMNAWDFVGFSFPGAALQTFKVVLFKRAFGSTVAS